MYSRILQISASELTTTYGNVATIAISKEDRSFDRSDIKLSILASVNSNLCGVIQNDDGAIFQINNFEIDSIYVSRHFD